MWTLLANRSFLLQTPICLPGLYLTQRWRLCYENLLPKFPSRKTKEKQKIHSFVVGNWRTVLFSQETCGLFLLSKSFSWEYVCQSLAVRKWSASPSSVLTFTIKLLPYATTANACTREHAIQDVDFFFTLCAVQRHKRNRHDRITVT